MLKGILRFSINVRLQYAFQYVRRNRNVKAIDQHGNLSIVLICGWRVFMIKGHGNVRKRTKKSIGGMPHNKRCIVTK